MNKQHLFSTAHLTLVASLVGWSVSALGQGTAGSNDAMLLLLEQNRNLQAEVQALRALVEEQGFEIRKLQRESLDRYTDTDNRLRNLEQSLTGGGTPVSVAPSTVPDISPPSDSPVAGTSEPPIISSSG
ncbi:MAG: hypothetical protein KJN90_00820, partial [Gammaproteobacteria bacterium]|nr:hypothetical protein [Gammaproteobacteria bacterium]